jgi:tetratricopeptide (TPR) repeat protein/predicted Ser/Thr protein kinase
MAVLDGPPAPADRTVVVVDKFLEQFEQVWQRGQRPALANYLPPPGHPARRELAIALAEIDLEYRLKAGDETPVVEAYFLLLPQELADPGVRSRLIAAEYRWRWRREPGVRREEYLRRFPDDGAELTARLVPSWDCPGCRETSPVSDEAAETVTCPKCGRTFPARPRPGDTLPSRTTEPAHRAPAAPWPRIPGYEIIKELGSGGMGVVYLARQVGHFHLNRLVALKMIQAGAQATAGDLARFEREAKAVARLQHPNVVQLYTAGEHNGRHYFAAEYVEGGNLAQKLAGTPQPQRYAAQLVEVLARAMHFAHQQTPGIVHRDLKPANILLAADGTPKITDFGLAKRLDRAEGQTQPGAILGTPSYMAPEQAQARHEDVGPATDIYALGAILYEIVTGRPPFLGETPLDTVLQVRTQEPVPPRRLQPNVWRDLETICLKCLEKDPQKRYATAEALADDLRRFLEARPTLARPIPVWERAWRWCRRNPRVASLLGLLVLAIAAGLAGVLWQWGHARAERDRARRSQRQALAAAKVLVSQVAEGIKPIAGTQSPTVERILDNVATVYDDLLQENESAEVLAGKAEMLNAVADVCLEMNRTGQAADRSAQALALFARLSREEPAQTDYQSGMALSQDLRGRVLVEQGHLGPALEAFREALAIRQRLAAREPDRPLWQAEIALSQTWIGNVLEWQGDRDGQRAAYEEAFAIRSRLAVQQPGNDQGQEDLGKGHEKLGDWFFWTDAGKAAEAYARAAAVYEAHAAKDPTNTHRRRNVVRATTSLGQAYLAKANGEGVQPADRAKWRKEAEACLQKSLGMAEQSFKLNPTSVIWRTEYLRCRLHLAYFREAATPAQRATVLRVQLRPLQELYETVVQLARQDPTSTRWPSEQANLLLQTGHVYFQLAECGEGAEQARLFVLARETLGKALAIQEPLTRQDPTNVGWSERQKALRNYLGIVEKQLKPGG